MGASSSNPVCILDFCFNSHKSLGKCSFLHRIMSNKFSDCWVLFLLEHDGFLRGRICQVFTSASLIMTESIRNICNFCILYLSWVSLWINSWKFCSADWNLRYESWMLTLSSPWSWMSQTCSNCEKFCQVSQEIKWFLGH